MIEYAQYCEMKPSKEPWLVQIPASWGMLRLKRIFSIKKDIAGEEGHTILSVTQKGIRPKVMSEKGQFAQDYSKYQLVNRGEFVMNHMDLLTGWVDISDFDGVTSPDYRVFVNTSPNQYDSNYYRYIFQLCYSARIFYGLGQGVAGFGRWRLPADMFMNFVLPVPSFNEQKAIAAYLDNQVGQIDSIITEAQASIDEYKQWKASVIFEAVTKGLNPDVEMTESGIEWIGRIPALWTCCQMKRVITLINGRAYKDTEFEEDGKYRVLRVGNLFTNSKWYTSSLELEDDKYCENGDLLYAWSASYGPYIWNGEKVIYHYHIWKTKLDDKIYKKYAYYYLLALSRNISSESHGSAMAHVTMERMNNSYIAFPSYEEQQCIANYLDQTVESIDALITEKENLLIDLETYKRSLIYEAVTGKRKVV